MINMMKTYCYTTKIRWCEYIWVRSWFWRRNQKEKNPRRWRRQPRRGPKWEQQYCVVVTWEEGDCKRRSCAYNDRWRGLVGRGDYRKIMWNVVVLSCSFASFKVRWDTLLNTAVLTDAVHHTAHTSIQSFPVYIILLCLEVSIYCIHSVILFLFSHYRHTPTVQYVSYLVQVRIKYVDTMWICVCVCVCTYTHTKMCIYQNNKANKTSMYLSPCKIWYTFHCCNISVIIFWKVAEVRYCVTWNCMSKGVVWCGVRGVPVY